ncbi:putative ribosomal protein S11, mitochondrial [Canna indica]|uniref:Ribosomal protein S11, mitochondrial n=1 Tax=Canna indica TaxID=4628 RepID=A0AAQ3K342_9LILI|nr:putative ribosomal protein S11, mitochondrial [Canna indica]
MKLESLVIVDQHAAVNMYLGPVHTARHTLGTGFARSIGQMITHDFCVPLVPQRPLVVLLPHTTDAQEKTRAETDRLGLAGAGNFKSMNFVQSISKEDERCSQKKKRDFVHVLLIKNKTFVTVTDARGNKKTGASAGCLEERKGRSRLSRYAAEATAEHVRRSTKKMGFQSVVMKVQGSTYFRKKNKVILSWREGFRGEGVGDQSPIMYIHDVTQLPHNGCRLPKKHRVQIVPSILESPF